MKMLKLACIPATVAIQSILFAKYASNRLKFSLFILLVGVGITTVTDVQYHPLGIMFGVLGMISTSLSQIWCSEFPERYKMSPTQFLHATIGYQAVWAGIACLIFENELNWTGIIGGITTSFPLVELIILSCLLGTFSHLFGNALIYYSSPVTFQVVGHAKTIGIILASYFIFGEPEGQSVLKSYIGTIVSLGGIIDYSIQKQKEIRQKKVLLESIVNEESNLLKILPEWHFKRSVVITRVMISLGIMSLLACSIYLTF